MKKRIKRTREYQRAYEDYVLHKQTYAELKVKYKKSRKTLRKHFDAGLLLFGFCGIQK